MSSLLENNDLKALIEKGKLKNQSYSTKEIYKIYNFRNKFFEDKKEVDLCAPCVRETLNELIDKYNEINSDKNFRNITDKK